MPTVRQERYEPIEEYIGDAGTHLARCDELVTGHGDPVDLSPHTQVSSSGIELQDREFVTALREGRKPNSDVTDVLPCYYVLDRLETRLAASAR